MGVDWSVGGRATSGGVVVIGVVDAGCVPAVAPEMAGVDALVAKVGGRGSANDGKGRMSVGKRGG